MLFLMLAAVLFALLVGALAFVTGPVGLTMAVVIGVWLLLYAGRGMLRRRSGGGPRSGGAGSSAEAAGRAAEPSVRQPSATRRTAQRTPEVAHHV